MIKHKIICALCLIWSSTVCAQEFTYEAKVEAPQSSGFHKIQLTAELLGKSQFNLNDIRLFDQAGVEQPYLKKRESQISTKALFKPYQIIEQASKGDTSSYLIFKNDSKVPIDNFSFEVINTDVRKRAKLSGSNDLEKWFAIKDNYLLHAMSSSSQTTEIKRLNFPLSNYTYFKLEIEDNREEPINIVKLGYYDLQKINGFSTSYNLPIKAQKDSASISSISLELPELMYLEKIQFELSGADYFSRPARLMVKEEIENAKGEKSEVLRQIGSMILNSNSTNALEVGGIITNSILLEIDNRDNRPLKLDHATASFLNRYVVADLEKDQQYVLKFGDATLRAPRYDIAAFESNIPANAPKLRHIEIQDLKPKTKMLKKEPSIFENVYLIWVVIVVVGLLLGFISFRMIKELGSRSNQS